MLDWFAANLGTILISLVLAVIVTLIVVYLLRQKKAGTIILLSTIFVWFTTYFGWAEDGFRMLSDEEINYSILAKIGGAIAWIFAPLGWGNWQAVVASITGLVAKENIVGTLGILYGGGDGTVYQNHATAFNGITGYSFLVFNLLCAPCFAAIGAIKREMNSQKWTWFAIGYQCGFAYAIALMVNQFGALFTGNGNVLGVIVGVVLLAFIVYMLVKPYKEATKLTAKIKYYSAIHFRQDRRSCGLASPPQMSLSRSDLHVFLARRESWHDRDLGSFAGDRCRNRDLSDPAEKAGQKHLRRWLRALRKRGLLPSS